VPRMCFLGAVEGDFLFNLQACFGLQWDDVDHCNGC